MRSPLYEELIHVPLVVHVPGRPAARLSHLTSALDLGPTLLDMAGAAVPSFMTGRSLLPDVLGSRADGQHAVVSAMPLANPGQQVAVVDDLMRTVAEWQPVTVTTDRWALLYSTSDEPIELYDLRADPRQQVNVATQHPDVVAELQEIYLAQMSELQVDKEYVTPRLPAGRV